MSKYQYALGIDLGGTTVKCGIFSMEGEMVEKWEIPTRKEENGKYVLSDIADTMKQHLSARGIALTEVAGAGLDVPGCVLNQSVVNRCVNIGWGVVDAGKELSQLLDGMLVKVGNDANVAALGEMWRGGGKGYRNLVMVTLGTGVGGAVIINEQIVEGAFGSAGEIGHMMMTEDEPDTCGCGRHGCLEQYCAAPGIVRVVKKALAASDAETSLRAVKTEALTTKDLFDEAKAGDAFALDQVETFAHMLGRALSIISVVVDPQVFIIGGGVSKAGEILMEAVERHYRACSYHATTGTEFRLATLGNDAGMYGAAKLVIG